MLMSSSDISLISLNDCRPSSTIEFLPLSVRKPIQCNTYLMTASPGRFVVVITCPPTRYDGFESEVMTGEVAVLYFKVNCKNMISIFTMVMRILTFLRTLSFVLLFPNSSVK